MVYACPISMRRIDSHLVRVVASGVSLLTILFLLTGESFFVGILLFDFTMRSLRKQHYSPMYRVAKYLLAAWHIKAKPCDEAPKRFALYLGWGIALLLLGTSLLHFDRLAMGLGILLLFCALLEALADYCIGCKLYYTLQWIQKFK
jgi:hypothetical protein